MCHGTVKIHRECGHQTTKYIDPCRSGFDLDDGICLGRSPAICFEVFWITQPALCVDCYRKKDIEIHSVYNARIKRTEWMIHQAGQMRALLDKDHDDILAQVSYDQDKIEAENLRHAELSIGHLQKKWRLEEELAQAKEHKQAKLAKLRSDTGVWGDG